MPAPLKLMPLLARRKPIDNHCADDDRSGKAYAQAFSLHVPVERLRSATAGRATASGWLHRIDSRFSLHGVFRKKELPPAMKQHQPETTRRQRGTAKRNTELHHLIPAILATNTRCTQERRALPQYRTNAELPDAHNTKAKPEQLNRQPQQQHQTPAIETVTILLRLSMNGQSV